MLYEIQEVGGAGGGASLSRVIEEHKDYIESTTKGPLNPKDVNSDLSEVLVEEEQKVLCKF